MEEDGSSVAFLAILTVTYSGGENVFSGAIKLLNKVREENEIETSDNFFSKKVHQVWT